MATHLQRQLDKLKRSLLSLGTLVEEGVDKAIVAIQTRDVGLADEVIAGDASIDELELDVEEECLHTLALHQPVAFDLRFVVAVLKINNDLERIGDLAVNVAQQARFLASCSMVDQMPFDLGRMSGLVQEMLKKSLDALVNLDPALAREVRSLDDVVDGIHRGMYDRITETMRENPEQIEQMIHLINVSRQLERMADHAVNVAKDVIYMAEGDIVRHRKIQERRDQSA
ncbi:phosphate signaling complex protein PhoU [Mucisphaera sp.]|uniref:phosphate signaling complex protein PhoU n=1 Tax=Mucisphaera sp. TaxID=2913024 RepID=UPI003D10361F